MAHLFPGRPRFLTTALDRFSETGRLLTGREAILNDNEVLALTGHDATLWEEMIRLELVISSSKALRTAKVTEKGGGFVAGEGDRAEELRRLADGIWNLPARKTIVMEVVEAWAYGFRVHEAVGVTEFRLDGTTYLRPKHLYLRRASHYAFTNKRDLVLLAGFGRKTEDQAFRTASANFHPDMLRWLVSTYGTTRTPYGAPVLEDVWLFYKLLGEFWEGLKSGLLASNGLLKLTQGTLSTSGEITTNLSLSEAKRQGREIAKVVRSDGLLISVGGMEASIQDTKASGEAWLAAIRELKSDMRERILGSTLSQSMPDGGATGSFALAKVQKEAPLAFARSDANEAGDSITDFVMHWLFANLTGETFDELELPHWESDLGKVPTLEHVRALVAMGAPVDAIETAKRWKATLVLEQGPDDLILETAAPQIVAAPDRDGEDKDPDDQNEPEDDEDS